MAGNFKVPNKKTIAIISIIIVLAIIAITGTVVFLKDRGSTEAAELSEEKVLRDTTSSSTTNNQQNSQTQDTQTPTENEQMVADNQEQNQATEQNANQETRNQTTTQNEETTETATNAGTTVNTGRTNVGNVGTTTTDNIQETTITRTEEVQIPEKKVSESHLLTWEGLNVKSKLSEIGTQQIVTKEDDMKVEKIATTKLGKDVVEEGDEITYTITVTSSDALQNFEVSDKIPEKTTYKSATSNGNAIKVGEKVVGIKWNVSFTEEDKQGDMYKKEVSFVVTVDKDATGTIINEDAVANGKKIEKPTKTSIITKNKSAEIIKGNTEYVEVGDEIKYTITATNTGDQDGKALIQDTIPTGTKFKDNSIQINDTSRTDLKQGDLESGITVDVLNNSTITLTFEVEVVSEVAKIDNTAFVNGNPTNPISTKTGAKIIFDENGGTDVDDITGVIAGNPIGNRTMPSTIKEGFKFAGWYDTNNAIVDQLPETYPAGTTTYKALWEGLKVTKTRIKIIDKDGAENPTFIDQEGDSIEYTIKIENIGDVAASNISITDKYDVNIISAKVAGQDVTLSEEEKGNIIPAGQNLLDKNNTTIGEGQSIEITVKYTAKQTEIDTALAEPESKIINEVTATLNGKTYTGTDATNPKDSTEEGKEEQEEGTEVRKRASYTVYYYENGNINEAYTINNKTAPVGATVSYENLPEAAKKAGYEYIKYVGIDGTDSKTIIDGENIIRVYLGKPDITIEKTAPTTVNVGEDIEYTITVTNKGWVGETVKVKDELIDATYKADSANIAPTSTDTNEQGHQVLIWNELNIEPANETTKSTTRTITFKVTTNENDFGKTKTNTAQVMKADDNKTTIDTSDSAQTKVNEVDVSYDEYYEGTKSKDLNIILLVDNSSSMLDENNSTHTREDGTVVNEKYDVYSGNTYAMVSPNDVKEKARLGRVKEALTKLQSKYANDSTKTMHIVRYNDSNSHYVYKISDSEQGYEVIKMYGDYYAKIGENNYELLYPDYDMEVYRSNNYVLASDGKAYKYVKVTEKQGAKELSSIEEMNIGNYSGGFSTYVEPAFTIAENIANANQDKMNVIVVLSDGLFDDNPKSIANRLVTNTVDRNGNITKKAPVDYIYSIAFGGLKNTTKLKDITNVYKKDADGNPTTEKMVYTASDTDSLLTVFDGIKEELSGKTKNTTTSGGIANFEDASKTIKVDDNCPLIATYTDAQGTPQTLFTCVNQDELNNCGITINGEKMTWDAKVFIRNHPGTVVPEKLSIKYYIPRN